MRALFIVYTCYNNNKVHSNSMKRKMKKGENLDFQKSS